MTKNWHRKAVCPKCGYTIRITRKWFDLAPPACPVDGRTLVLDTVQKIVVN